MRDFRAGGSGGGQRGGFDRGRRSFGGRNNFDRGPRPDRQMFKTVCSNCGNECEVPFKPTGEKPVYCSDCFGKMGGKDDRRSFDRPRYSDRGVSGDNNKAMLETVNAKLDKILSLLQPSEVK